MSTTTTTATAPAALNPDRLFEAMPLLFARKDLTREHARDIMEEIFSGRASGMQIAMFVTALRMKGEVTEELIGFVQAVRAHAAPVRAHVKVAEDISDTGRESLVEPWNEAQPGHLAKPWDNDMLDTCGTGGDVSGTFNISTAVAFVVAAAGVRIAKHSNRSISSKCGSVDVIEAMGINVALSPAAMSACIDEVGISFLIAPSLHKAWQYAQPVRRDIKIRTVFNMLGPLCNPAGAASQLSGVYEPRMTGMHARVLAELGTRRAMVVHGLDGLDEITTTTETQVGEVVAGEVKEWLLNPEDYGIARAKPEDLLGGEICENVAIIKRIFDGEKGPKRDIVLLNAGTALAVAGRAADIKEGIAVAAEAIDSGAARKKLADYITFTNRPDIMAMV
jgi:anthranilate phosphoribosyltransferase